MATSVTRSKGRRLTPIYSGRVIGSTAGWAERFIETSTQITAIVIQARPSNRGVIFGFGMDADESTNDGLPAGEWLSFEGMLELNEFWMNPSKNNEGVNFWATGVAT